MATVGASVATLIDWAKRKDPDGKIAQIVELLGQTNELLVDMLWKEGNMETGHRMTVRTGLPTVSWRLLNQGVSKSKSTTAQMDEQVGMLEGRSEVDIDLAKMNGEVNAFRMSESVAFAEQMNQQMATTLIYGNAGVNPEQFTGIFPRYASTTAGNGSNVILGGGTGSDNSSIVLCGWGENTVFGVYPKGSEQGLIHQDLGEIDAFDSNSNRFRAYADRWQWKCGLAVKDWRYIVRIANIDISNLVAKSSAADLVDKMIRAVHRIPNLRACRPVFYANRTVREMLDIQRRDSVQIGGQLNYSVVDGQEVLSLRGIPIRTLDALTETEATIS